jgi:hypothetical protein
LLEAFQAFWQLIKKIDRVFIDLFFCNSIPRSFFNTKKNQEEEQQATHRACLKRRRPGAGFRPFSRSFTTETAFHRSANFSIRDKFSIEAEA